MINGENFFDQPIKDNKVTYQNIRKIATGNFNFTTNLDRADNTRIYFILEKTKETKLDFSQGTVKLL